MSPLRGSSARIKTPFGAHGLRRGVVLGFAFYTPPLIIKTALRVSQVDLATSGVGVRVRRWLYLGCKHMGAVDLKVFGLKFTSVTENSGLGPSLVQAQLCNHCRTPYDVSRGSPQWNLCDDCYALLFHPQGVKKELGRTL